MRSDMAKVVTERPRRGGWGIRSANKTHLAIHPGKFEDDDHGTTRHPIARRRQFGWNAKEFSDLINPLRRYLVSKIGKKWNDIYSELSKTLDRRSMAGRHIWSHVTGEVELNCEIFPDGNVYSRRYGFGRVHGLYVHPITGKLEFAKGTNWYSGRSKDEFWRYNRPTYQMADGRLLEQHDGIWFYVTTVSIPQKSFLGLGKNGEPLWGVVMTHKTTKKQLSKKELKLEELTNYQGPRPTDAIVAKKFGFV